ncbi:MAG: hypothetical protein NDI77_08500, partial [Geobacteraceae bacterium]|nr:hypothetical protein [Geobacteraceae bacterium]
MKLWIPVATSNGEQAVRLAKVTAPVPLEPKKEGEYGNSLLYGRVNAPAKELEIELQYEVTRIEKKGNLTGSGAVAPASGEELARFLAPDRLVPLNDRVR